MKNLSKIIIILITFLNVNNAQAHVSHYDKLKGINFEIYRKKLK